MARTYDNGTYSFSYAPDSIGTLSDNDTIMQFKRQVTEPGLYYITAVDNETVDNVTKVLHSDTIAIMADDRAALDTKLKGKWGGMLSGFADPNMEKSLSYISILSNEKYREAFTQLLPQFATIAADFQGKPMELIYVRGNIAKYRLYIDCLIPPK